MSTDIAERFWQKVQKGDGCWVWTGAVVLGKREKYGRFLFNGKVRGAHRVAWELTNGPIPEGIFVLHHCDNPPCVRPDHLFLGTNSTNMLDAARKGRMVNQPYGPTPPDGQTRRDSTRRHSERFPDSVAEDSRRYRARHPERIRESRARYKEAHPERIRESNRRYHEKHR